ncbi:hypothetical protein CLV70_102129 [Pseudosporangium ferrugineum]|uniref:Uncharacterized protein n=1 Tax=Pseudosporangium ferrugineum TaxID=439699 RepID=A0A2T0SES2_9ACTN|nr:hypothetical protein CLV70_102129 [Pseudosporangium ferrugineum]
MVSVSGSGPGTTRDQLEAALRHLGRRNHGEPSELLRYAFEVPESRIGRELAALTRPAVALTGWTAGERAEAVWGLVREGVVAPDVGPTRGSRRRHALFAAFRLPVPGIAEPWRGSLHDRFKQLAALPDVFGDPTTTQPMEMAWKRGVRALATHLDDRFRALAEPGAWAPYRPRDSGRREHQPAAGWPVYFGEPSDSPTGLRQPSPGAQPVFVNLFVTTVFMRRRAVYRRITERLVTARRDDVAYYTARGFAGAPPRITYVPVQALWGCTAEFVESPRPGRPAVTRLRFPAPLRAGERAHFASEVIDENIEEERLWVDVDVDHYGIARGQVAYGGLVPVSGLTIRIRFDHDQLPESVWWYAEANQSERYDPPPKGDRRLLPIIGRDVQFTFTDRPCQPRESYGLAFSWPTV